VSTSKYFGLYHVEPDSIPISKIPQDSAFQKGYINQDEMDILFPINPVTGMRDDVLSQIVDPNTGDLKKNQLLGLLQKNTVPQHRSVDDETLLSLLQSRFTQSLVECDDFARYVENIVNNGLKPDDSDAPSDKPDVASDSDAASDASNNSQS
jgi:hypothetical protein